jgi:hypothetical protein
MKLNTKPTVKNKINFKKNKTQKRPESMMDNISKLVTKIMKS